jgi:hypothetical protein
MRTASFSEVARDAGGPAPGGWRGAKPKRPKPGCPLAGLWRRMERDALLRGIRTRTRTGQCRCIT